MNDLTPSAEGYIEVTGGKVWYKVVGDWRDATAGNGTAVNASAFANLNRVSGGQAAGKTPVILLHGGPGFTSISMEPIAALAKERPVIFYDQLGSGNSDRPADSSLWVIDRFVEELAQVRRALNLHDIHILGHSWGTMLASAYLRTKPTGVKSVIFSSSCLNAEIWARDQDAYRKQLPVAIQEVMSRSEREGTTDSPEYEAAMLSYYQRHYCRLEPWPDILNQDFQQANMDVYHTMWGPAEFYATGNLKNFDGTKYLQDLHLPTLFTCGRFDESTPAANEYYQSLAAASELHIFEHSGHMTYVEEPDEYVRVIGEFLNRHDG